MSEVQVYQGASPTVQLSLACSLRRVAKVNDSCDAEVVGTVAYLCTSAHLYCVNCESVQVAWNCALPGSGFRRLWVCAQSIWVADDAGTLVNVSPPSQTATSFQLQQAVQHVFEVQDRLFAYLKDGKVVEKRDSAWSTAPAPSWLHQLQSSHLRQVLSLPPHLILITTTEVLLVTEPTIVKCSFQGQFVHAAMTADPTLRVTLLLRDQTGQVMQDLSLQSGAWVVGRSERVTGSSLLKLLGGDYVLEYANASIWLSRLSVSEAVAQLKKLIAAGKYREAEPVLEALGDAAVPLLRGFFETTSKVQEVTGLLKLAKLLPSETITALCNDLIRNPPSDVDCAVHFFTGAQKLISEVSARASLEPLRQCFSALVHKSETYRLVRNSLKTGFADFLRSDLMEEVREFLTRGALREGLCLLRRHFQGFGPEVVGLLQYLPEKFPVRALVDWLRCEFVPLLAADQLLLLETWIEQRARGLADVDSALALELATVVSASQESHLIAGAGTFAVARQHRQLPDLLALQTQLRALLGLRTSYGLTITFNDYLRLSPEDFAEMMLQRLDSGSHVSAQLRQHFHPYVQAQGWKSDTILLNFFLKKQTLPGDVTLALVQEIQDEECRAKAAQYVLEAAQRPLSAEMKTLAQTCAKHQSYAAQVLFADILEAGLKLQLPQLNPNDRYQMLQLLDVLSVRADCTLLAVKLARLLDLESDAVFQRQIYFHVDQGTLSKLSVAADLTEQQRRNVLRNGFRYSLAMLEHNTKALPQHRKLEPLQAEIYNKALTAIEFLGQLLVPLLNEEQFDRLVREPMKAAPHLRRLARDYQLFLTFEEWKNRKVAAEVLAAMAAVQKPGEKSLKRKRPEELAAFQKRTKVQLAHLSTLLDAGRPHEHFHSAEFPALQLILTEKLEALAARPTAPAVEDLNTALRAHLASAPANRAQRIVHIQLLCSMVRYIAQLSGVVGAPFKLEVQEYQRSSGRFLFCDEALSVSREDFSAFVRTVAAALRSNEVKGVMAWGLANNAAVALLPLRLEFPRTEAQAMVETLTCDVLRARQVDSALTLSLLLTLPAGKGFDLLSKAASRPDNSLEISRSIAGLAVALASLTRVADLRAQWLLRDANVTWKHRLTGLGIPFDPAIFSQAPSAPRLCDLIPALLAKSQSYDLVLEFCRSYGLPEIEAVSAFVEQQLLVPKVRPEFVPHLSDPPEVIAEMLAASPFENDYQGAVRAVLANLPKESMMPILGKCLQRIPQVDYDRVLFVFSLLVETGIFMHYAKRKQMIELLLDFRRGVAPSPAEETAMRDFLRYYPPELTNLCEALYLVKVPLDFLFTSPKETLAREVTVRTLDRLLPVAVLYKCDPDFLRMTAVSNEMLAHMHAQRGEACGSCPTLAALKGVIAKLRNFADKYELALKVAHFFPVSEELVGAANFCRVTAGLWLETLTPDSEQHQRVQGFVKDCEKTAKTAALQFELKEYGLLPEFGHLTATPTELISQLIHQLAPKLPSGESPVSEEELWSVVTALAKRSDLQLDRVLEALVQEWVAVALPAGTRAYSLRRTESSAALETRLLFLARHWDLLAVISTLLRFVEAESGADVTLRQKTEALGLLLKICPKSELEKMLPREKLLGATVEEYYQHCCYLVDLEEMRIPYRMETLLNCDKASFVRALLVSYSSEARVVQLAACLICDFRITAPDLLTSLMNLLAELQDFEALCAFLHTLALRGALTHLAHTAMDTLVLCMNHLKTLSFERQKLILATQVGAFAAIVERLDPPNDKLSAFIQLLLDGFFPLELMEHLIPACVRLILQVPDPDTLQTLSQTFAARFAGSYPLLVVRAMIEYVSDYSHPLVREAFFKVEEEGNYKPLLTAPDLLLPLCSFLVKHDRCKRLLKLAKQQLGRSALCDISNSASRDAAIREVVARLQRTSL